jgi:hypothetical protein
MIQHTEQFALSPRISTCTLTRLAAAPCWTTVRSYLHSSNRGKSVVSRAVVGGKITANHLLELPSRSAVITSRWLALSVRIDSTIRMKP